MVWDFVISYQKKTQTMKSIRCGCVMVRARCCATVSDRYCTPIQEHQLFIPHAGMNHKPRH